MPAIIPLWALYSILVFATVAAPAAATEARTITRLMDAVVVQGEVIRPFWGHKIAQLRLYAFRDSQWQPIPYQIDKVDSDGNYVRAPFFDTLNHEAHPVRYADRFCIPM